MTAITIFSFLIGTVFGMRFKVFVLGPASLVAIVVIAVATPVLGETSWSALMAMVVSLASLQMGFLGGMTIESVIAIPRRVEKPLQDHGAKTPSPFSA
jgi:hypothetical protein